MIVLGICFAPLGELGHIVTIKESKRPSICGDTIASVVILPPRAQVLLRLVLASFHGIIVCEKRYPGMNVLHTKKRFVLKSLHLNFMGGIKRVIYVNFPYFCLKNLCLCKAMNI